MNAIHQYQDYLRWLSVKHREITVDRAKFWREARPYTTDWSLAGRYHEMLRFVVREMDMTRAALEREVEQKKTRLRYRVAKLYLKRVVALFVWR